MTIARATQWRRLIGVYDTNGGLLGELAYLTGRLLGIAHCALCEITNDASGEKPAFEATRRSIGMPLELTHRNEVSGELRGLVEGRTPCVVGETDEGFEVLLGRADLEACRGDVLCLEWALRRAIDEAGPAEADPGTRLKARHLCRRRPLRPIGADPARRAGCACRSRGRRESRRSPCPPRGRDRGSGPTRAR